jgi:hypothetical protein
MSDIWSSPVLKALTGNTVGAENYYQHARTLFQVDVLGQRSDIGDFATTTAVIKSG